MTEANLRLSRHDVAVVVPIYSERYTDDERISVRHLKHYLGAYDHIAITPSSLDHRDTWEGEYLRFPDSDFANRASYSRLLLSPRFYSRFGRYDFILIYQLDSLVFSDQLLMWCQKGYDYIGASWPQPPNIPLEYQWYPGPERCGNGGFSLRNVANHLHVLRLAQRPGTYFRILREELREHPNPFVALRRVAKASPLLFRANEDVFWSFHASQYDKSFSVSPVAEGVQFSFELSPSWCYERNARRLPFGCHAWASLDRQFWEPHLL